MFKTKLHVRRTMLGGLACRLTERRAQGPRSVPLEVRPWAASNGGHHRRQMSGPRLAGRPDRLDVWLVIPTQGRWRRAYITAVGSLMAGGGLYAWPRLCITARPTSVCYSYFPYTTSERRLRGSKDGRNHTQSGLETTNTDIRLFSIKKWIHVHSPHLR